MTGDGNARRRLRLTDLFLFLLLLLCIAGIAFREWDRKSRTVENLSFFTLEAEWRDTDARTAGCLREGDVLYTAAGEVFGTVTAVSAAPATIRLWTGRELCEGILPDGTRYDVALSVRVSGRFSEGILLRDGTHPVNAGQTYLLWSDLAEIPLLVLFCSPEAVSE